jgi:hypothetical protein
VVVSPWHSGSRAPNKLATVAPGRASLAIASCNVSIGLERTTMPSEESPQALAMLQEIVDASCCEAFSAKGMDEANTVTTIGEDNNVHRTALSASLQDCEGGTQRPKTKDKA